MSKRGFKVTKFQSRLQERISNTRHLFWISGMKWASKFAVQLWSSNLSDPSTLQFFPVFFHDCKSFSVISHLFSSFLIFFLLSSSTSPVFDAPAKTCKSSYGVGTCLPATSCANWFTVITSDPTFKCVLPNGHGGFCCPATIPNLLRKKWVPFFVKFRYLWFLNVVIFFLLLFNRRKQDRVRRARVADDEDRRIRLRGNRESWGRCAASFESLRRTGVIHSRIFQFSSW